MREMLMSLIDFLMVPDLLRYSVGEDVDCLKVSGGGDLGR